MNPEKAVHGVLLAIALSALGGLALITVFIFLEGIPFFATVGLRQFLLTSDWDPEHGRYGVYAMIVSSLYVTFGALFVGAPLGIAGAVFLTEFAPKPVMRAIKPMIELLAGIPSVVFGFIGVVVLAPVIREHLGGPGLSLIAAALILGIMILPTVMSISIDAINVVPMSFREGSLALGATRWQTVHMVVLRAARSGIIAGVILGMGRALGETMAVLMVAGNAVRVPGAITDSVRTLTANIALEMGYATGQHRQALFATGVVLFVMIMLLNSAATLVITRRGRKS